MFSQFLSLTHATSEPEGLTFNKFTGRVAFFQNPLSLFSCRFFDPNKKIQTSTGRGGSSAWSKATRKPVKLAKMKFEIPTLVGDGGLGPRTDKGKITLLETSIAPENGWLEY